MGCGDSCDAVYESRSPPMCCVGVTVSLFVCYAFSHCLSPPTLSHTHSHMHPHTHTHTQRPSPLTPLTPSVSVSMSLYLPLCLRLCLSLSLLPSPSMSVMLFLIASPCSLTRTLAKTHNLPFPLLPRLPLSSLTVSMSVFLSLSLCFLHPLCLYSLFLFFTTAVPGLHTILPFFPPLSHLCQKEAYV